MKICKGCKEEKDESKFRADKRNKNGLQARCIDCENKYNRERLSQVGSSYMLEYVKRKDNNQNLKFICRVETRRLVKLGIIKKHNCEVCGEEKVENHHEDYKNPYKIKWLCKKHHMELHRKL